MTKYRQIAPDDLLVDERYQRELVPGRVARIVKNFDPHQLGVLEVSERDDGTLAVFDGQHRLAALKELGKTRAPCLVHRLKPEAEAALFTRLQLDRKALRAVERFRAQLFSGDQQAFEIFQCVQAAGFEVLDHAKANGHSIRAISAVERVYGRVGGEGLSATLNFIEGLWGGDERSTDGHFIEGVAQFLNGYGDRIGKPERQRLAAQPPVMFLRRARAAGLSDGGYGIGRHVVDRELRKVAQVRGRPALARKVPA